MRACAPLRDRGGAGSEYPARHTDAGTLRELIDGFALMGYNHSTWKQANLQMKQDESFNKEKSMSFFNGTIFSDALKMDTDLGVILPQDSRVSRGYAPLAPGVTPQKKPKTLILLHGLSDGHAVWTNRTSLLRYAEDYGVAVVMPEVQRGFYQNMKYGLNYADYVCKELPKLAGEMFNISVKPEDLMVAGLSMGGYGAMYAALTYPDKFSGVGCFSAAYDIKAICQEGYTESQGIPGFDKDRKGIFGDPSAIPESSDLFALVEKVAAKAKKPRVFMTCGTEDFLHESNIKMRDAIKKTKAFDLKFEEWPGVHEWGFWDISIQKMLKHFLGK
jgi:S-formylglutathione hydrolase FrmB